MEVFISWSGEKSRAAAQALREWLQEVFDVVEPWVSAVDIKAGALWFDELRTKLKESDFFIICLDRQSLTSQWVLFEAGFAASEPDKPICSYLLDLDPLDISTSPLSAYQVKQATRDGTWSLVRAINSGKHGELLKEKRLEKKFEREWPSLEERLKSLPRQMLTADQGTVQRRAKVQGPKHPELSLFNTLYFARQGHVTHDWQSIHEATGIPHEELVICDDQGNELPAQVDFFGPSDPTPPTLAFSLLTDIPPAQRDFSIPSSYVTLERGQPTQWEQHEPQLVVEEDGGRVSRVRLINNRLEVGLELQPEPLKDGRGYYSGAVTTVLLDGWEIMATYSELLDIPDVEKRCMQLDRLHLLTPDGQPMHKEPFKDLVNNWYELVSKSSGPVRSVVTIASKPYYYSPANSPAGGGHRYEFRLYRVISLYRGANYVTEELKVYGSRADAPGDGPVSLGFQTRYFSCMDMGLDLEVDVAEQRPQWFAVGSKWAPFQGYGFATSADLSPVANPHPGFPKLGYEHKTFSWGVRDPRKPLLCAHLFTRGAMREPEVQRVWEEVISKPLVARLSE